ncbi:MAG: carbohydrate ABC transporter permease [Acidobacteria bacterium]|nr:carbohydrate ABC transporter permease [Acidobacteriota bacterium]
MSTISTDLDRELDRTSTGKSSRRRLTPSSKGTGRTRGRRIRVAALYMALVLMLAVVMIPFLWMVSASLKTNNEIFAVPIKWIPDNFQWSNYAAIWGKVPMMGYIQNTAYLAVIITGLQVLTGSFAAYGFAKIRFKGRDVLFMAYIGTIAIPWQSYMVPQYIMMEKMGLTNTFWSLILLQAFGAFGVFLMRQFYMTIPDELCEAARIDGLSEYGIWARVILPLSKPALASLALLTFVNTWNDYMGPFIYLTSNRLWTIQIGLQSFIGQYDAEYGMIMTGSVISVIPILIIFLLGQRYFIQGIATSGMKG